MLLFSRNNILKTQPEPLTLRKRAHPPGEPSKHSNFTIEKLYDLQKQYKLNFFGVHGIDLDTRKCTCGNKNCSAPGKHPINKGWFKESRDPMRLLLSSNNIGLITGQKIQNQNKYLIIIDFDKENLELKAKLPKTIVTKTGRDNGQHFWFFSKTKIPNSVGIIADKVDVRGSGGYVIAPGSMHASGITYVFLNNGASTIADLPEWLEKKLNEKIYVKNTKQVTTKSETFLKSGTELKIAKKYLENGLIPTGFRNSIIYRLVLAKRANGHTRTELLKYAQTLKEFHCENPNTLHDSELASIVYNVMNRCKQPFYVNTNLKCFYERITSKKIVEIDKKFFETAFEKDDSGSISFKQIMELREFWHKHHKTHSFVMKGSLVGVLLKSLGFQKKHTEKGNVWKIKLAKDFKLLYDEHCKQNSMKTEDKTVVKEFEVEIVVHPNEKKYQSDGTVEKQQLIIENIDKEIETEPELTSKMLEFLKNDIQVDDIIGFDENIWRVAEHDKNKVPFIKNLIEVKRQHGKYVEKQSAKNLVPTIFNLFEQYKIGYLEILYRNNKVFGIETKKKVKISY